MMSLGRFGLLTLLLTIFLKVSVNASEKTPIVSSGDPEFSPIPSLSVPIIRNGVVEKYLFLTVTLEMMDSDAKEEAESFVPRIKDIFFRTLFTYFGSLQPGTSAVNIRMVKAHLLNAGKRALGKGKVKAVLVQNAFEQDLNLSQ